jgi:hypothetical protein
MSCDRFCDFSVVRFLSGNSLPYLSDGPSFRSSCHRFWTPHFMYTYAYAYKNKVVEDFKCETFQLSTTRLLTVYHMSEPDQRALKSAQSHQHTHTPSFASSLLFLKQAQAVPGTCPGIYAQHAPTITLTHPESFMCLQIHTYGGALSRVALRMRVRTTCILQHFEVMRLCYWYTPLILPHYAVGRQGEVELILERGCSWIWSPCWLLAPVS